MEDKIIMAEAEVTDDALDGVSGGTRPAIARIVHCPNCGDPVDPRVEVCPNCGAKVPL